MTALVPASGKNAPADDTELLRERLLETASPLISRYEQLQAAFEDAPEIIADEKTNGKVADLARQISACRKNAEAMRVAEKEPHMAASRAVDGFFKNTLLDKLDGLFRTLEKRITIFQRAKAEKERLAREAEARRLKDIAEKEAEEAAKKAAAMQTPVELGDALKAEDQAKQTAADAAAAAVTASASNAELSRTRGDQGAVASLRTFWDFRDLDRAKIDLEALRPYLTVADIEKALRGAIKAGCRKINGAEIFENTATTIR